MPAARFTAPLLLLAVVVATLLVHIRSLVSPIILHDDFDLLLKVWTWDDTRSNLWVPMNEHAWPITRLWTYAMIQAAGSSAGIPLSAAVANRVLVLATVGLTYLFVRRDRGHPAPGLAAAALFGVSAVYQEAVYWFAAGPSVAATATGLLALLAAQRWRRSGGVVWLIVAAVWCALAPGWFAGGILAGPFCALYLIGRGTSSTDPGKWWAWVVPVLGTGAFLAVNLKMAGDRILNAEHYGGKTAVQAFDPIVGAGRTVLSLVDGLALGATGAPGVATPVWTAVAPTPVWIAIPVVIALVAGLIWWWRRATDRRLILLGLAFVLVSYWLIHSARARWEYDRLAGWSRYAVYPQMGLALILAGGWPGGFGTPFTRRQARAIGMLTAVLFVTQLTRGFCNSPTGLTEQMEALRQVDRVSERCRELGISATDAAAVLPSEDIPGGDKNRWWFLRGSDHPRELTAEELAELPAKLMR